MKSSGRCSACPGSPQKSWTGGLPVQGFSFEVPDVPKFQRSKEGAEWNFAGMRCVFIKRCIFGTLGTLGLLDSWVFFGQGQALPLLLKFSIMIKQFFLFLIFSATVAIAGAQCLSGDCTSGNGVYKYPSGAKYEGHFKNGEIDGIGTCYYTDGSSYTGEWVARYPEGKGTKTYPDGTKRTGLWKKGQPVDEAGNPIPAAVANQWEKKNDGTDVQSGCIEGNCRTGDGIFAFPDGSKYEGQFLNGKIDGWGTWYYANGDKYVGTFRNNYAHGKGTLYHKDSTKVTGDWVEGEYRGNSIIEKGRIGCVEGNCHTGTGTYIYKDGSAKYTGQFVNDLPDGEGAIFYANGERYVGMWKAGEFNGKGTLYRLDNTEVAGYWGKGVFKGKNDVAPVEKIVSHDDDLLAEEGADQQRSNPRLPAADATPASKTEPAAPDSDNELPMKVLEEGTVVAIADKPAEPAATNTTTSDTATDTKTDITESPATTPVHVVVSDDHEPVRDLADEPQQSTKAIPDRFRPEFKVWAVVVGIAAYNHMPALRYTDDDAYRFYAFLKSPEGGGLPDEQIQVLIDEDATRQNILTVMENTFVKAGPNDLVMLYFSGHGLQGSFLPYDYDGFNNKLLHEDLNDIFDRSPARYKLCIADACHSGSLLAMKGASTESALATYYQTLGQAQAGTALIMSSKSEETSLESTGLRQGVFSHFLIRGLKGEADTNGNKVVAVQELFDFISEGVREYTGNRQSPVIKGNYDPAMTVAVMR